MIRKEWVESLPRSTCGVIDEARAYYVAGVHHSYMDALQASLRCWMKRRMELAQDEILAKFTK